MWEYLMSRSAADYTKDIAKRLKNVARDNAVRNGVNDEGFHVRITKNDIKQGTDRSRIKSPVITTIVNTLNSAGFKAEGDNGEISVFVPPILGKKDTFTLEEIAEREKIIEEINTRETYRLSNE